MIRILIPLDGSPAAEHSLLHAQSIAKTFSAELTLLRVVEDTDNQSAVRTDSLDLELLRHQTDAYLDDLRTRFTTPELSISCQVVEGRPAESIVNCLGKGKYDLIILTRYGRGKAEEFAAGGTAQKIVSGAECSVLLLDPRRSIDAQHGYQRILVPIDDSKNSDCALAIATMIAEIHRASLMLLYVTDEPNLPVGLPVTRHARELSHEMSRLIRHESERRLRELAAKIPSQVPVTTRVLVSHDSSLAIESTAEEHDSDLLVLHTNGASSTPGSHYDSASQALILYSHRALFVLHGSAREGFASNFRSVYLDAECDRNSGRTRKPEHQAS